MSANQPSTSAAAILPESRAYRAKLAFSIGSRASRSVRAGVNLNFHLVKTRRAKQPIELASNLRLPNRNRLRRRENSIASLARGRSDIKREHVPVAVDCDYHSARRRHPRHFGDSIGCGIDIFKNVLAPDAVEGGVWKRQRWKTALHELRRELCLARASARSLDELGVDIHARHFAARSDAPRKLESGVAGAGTDVEHAQTRFEIERT